MPDVRQHPAMRLDVATDAGWEPSPALLGALARCLVAFTDRQAARGAVGGPRRPARRRKGKVTSRLT
jgi:hypothetical protein